MTTPEISINSPPRSFRWDLVVTLVLALLVATVALLDAGDYIHRTSFDTSMFALTDITGRWVGKSEFFRRGATMVRLGNIGEKETNDHNFRHAMGPTSMVEIWSDRDNATLRLRFYNVIKGENITLGYDGQTLEQLDNVPEGPIERTFPLKLQRGSNEFTITFDQYNHHGIELAKDDGRPMAGDFTLLDVQVDP